MKKSLFLLLTIGVAVAFTACSENGFLPGMDEPIQVEQSDAFLKGAKKPAASLMGTLDCPFTFTPPTFWNGTIDFGDLGVFGLTFFSLTEPRTFSMASTFEEEWVIYYEGTDYNDPANVVMRGMGKGVETLNKLPEPIPFLENGKVLEAFGPLEAWEGCNWHVRGLVYMDMEVGLPVKAVGDVRIN